MAMLPQSSWRQGLFSLDTGTHLLLSFSKTAYCEKKLISFLKLRNTSFPSIYAQFSLVAS